MFPTRIKMTGTSATITPDADLATLGTRTGTGGERNTSQARPPYRFLAEPSRRIHLRRSAELILRNKLIAELGK